MLDSNSFVMFYLALCAVSGYWTLRRLENESAETLVVLLFHFAALGAGYLVYHLHPLPLWQVILGACVAWLAGGFVRVAGKIDVLKIFKKRKR